MDQASIQSTTRLFAAKNHVDQYIKNNLGLVKNVDYDGIIFLFWKSSSALNWGGAKGMLNNDFIWACYSDLSFKLVRHEIGHNFGHDHHSRNHYVYRETRNLYNYKADGFDLVGHNNFSNCKFIFLENLKKNRLLKHVFFQMSGGNNYAVSDFHVASKWFFNWVENASIVNMQPEGPTAECPECVSSGSFTLKAFDMRMSPETGDILGVHIPITTKFDTNYNSDYVYSYWLSYRSGVDGHAEGLSIHLTIFELYSSSFGAYYDSLNYYAHGSTDSKYYSVVENGNCYHVYPASFIKDQDLLAAEAVQPIVCVNKSNIGLDMEISVSFLDVFDPNQHRRDVVQHNIQCGVNDVMMSLDSTQNNLISVTGTGGDGQVTVMLCNPTRPSEALFFD